LGALFGEIAMTTSREALRRDIDALRWFHQIDFGDGVLSPGWIKASKVARVSKILFDMNVTGKSVLDIGCWDGAYSLEATRRGAARVLATDHFSWNKAWGDRRAFELVRRNLAPSIEVMDIDIPDLSVATVGTFDIVLFCGVFYHLRHPFATLERIAALATECLVLETHLMRLPFTSKPHMRFYPGSELNGDPTNWWSPNRACVEAMLRDVGFKTITMKHPDYRRRRGIFHAWR
jgi:tRNA (mo5U34)-methyltransferase